MKTSLFTACAAAILMTAANSALAQSQTNGVNAPITQTFRLTVPKNITITCPDTLVEATHDGNDANQVFTPQTWEVKGNSPLGVTVTFTLVSPFTTGAGNADHLRRDASLAIAQGTIQGPASWNNASGTVATNILGGVNSAFWQSRSSGVGTSTFNLTMTFLNSLNGNGFGTYQEGIYETTVRGEVTENL